MSARHYLLGQGKYILDFVLMLLILLFLILSENHKLFAAGADDFIIKIKTDNTCMDSSNQTSFTLTTFPGETYNYSIDWDGNGTVDEHGNTGNATHDYKAVGIFTIRISGTFPRIYFRDSKDTLKIISIEQWGSQVWKSMREAFRNCKKLSGNTIDTPNLSNVTDMSGMFYNAYEFNQAIGNWDVSKVTDMSGMFYNAHEFNQAIGNWDVSKVTDMSGMFCSAHKFNQAIGNWDVSKVKNMSAMFLGAFEFNQAIGSWDLSKVEYGWNVQQSE
jgi:surface protein